MLNIQSARIDERLVHGQILVKWIQLLKCETVIIVNDLTADDPVLNQVLRISFPRDINYQHYKVKDGIEAIINGTDQSSTLLLMRNIETLEALIERQIRPKEINIVRIPYQTGRVKLYDNLYLTQRDREYLISLAEQGLDLFVQMVPDSERICLEALLKGEPYEWGADRSVFIHTWRLGQITAGISRNDYW